MEELRDRVDLREELAVVAEEARSGVDPVHLAQWGETKAVLRHPAFRLRVRLHTVLGLAGFAALWIHLVRAANLIPLSDGVDALLRDLFLVALVVNGWFLYRQSAILGVGGLGGGRGGPRTGAAFRSAGAHGARAVPLVRCWPDCARRSMPMANRPRGNWRA